MTKLDEFLDFEISGSTIGDDREWITKAKEIIRKQAEFISEIANSKFGCSSLDCQASFDGKQCQKEIESLLEK